MTDIKIQDINSNHRVIVESYPQIEYTLIYRNTNFEPWVAAWCYDEETQTWAQGHYFSTLLDAVEYIESKFRR